MVLFDHNRQDEFVAKILSPVFFRRAASDRCYQFSSFHRQFNAHNFKKEKFKIPNSDTQYEGFSNEFFHRDKPELMCKIKSGMNKTGVKRPRIDEDVYCKTPAHLNRKFNHYKLTHDIKELVLGMVNEHDKHAMLNIGHRHNFSTSVIKSVGLMTNILRRIEAEIGGCGATSNENAKWLEDLIRNVIDDYMKNFL